MGKRIWLTAAVICLICFTGCGKTLALSDRSIVKAVYAEKGLQGYEVAVVVAEEEKEESSFSLKWAESNTIANAMHKLEEESEKKLFYGQNQLLLVGKNASKSDFSQALEYFSAEQSSRPNMAVYATKMDKKEFEEWADSKNFEDAVLRLEKNLENSQKTARMIFEIETTEKGVQGFVPLLEVEKEETDTTQLVLYRDDKMQECLGGEQAQIARLLLGMQTELNISQDYEGEEVRFSVDDPQILRTVQVGTDGPVLNLTLTGTVRGVSADHAQRQAQLSGWKSRKDLSLQISQNIVTILNKTVEKAWNPSDPFGFCWWFLMWNAADTASLIETKQLWEYASISADVNIRVI